MRTLTNAEKDLYFGRLCEHGEVLKDSNSSESKEMKEFLLFPKDSYDLFMANAYMDYLDDLKVFESDVNAGNIRTIDLNNSLYFDLLKCADRCLKSSMTETIEEFKKSYLSRFDSEGEYIARLSFDMIVANSSIESIGIVRKAVEENDFDMDNIATFGLDYVMRKLNIIFPKFYTRDQHENQRFLDFKNTFHKLVEESVKDKKDNSAKKYNK